MVWNRKKRWVAKVVTVLAALATLVVLAIPAGMAVAGPGTVKGSVTKPDGSPWVMGGHVQVESPPQPFQPPMRVADGGLNPDGTFSISGVPDGNYQVAVHLPPEAGLPPAPKPIQVVGGATVELQFQISVPSKTVRGRVLLENGAPVPNVDVHANQGMGGAHNMARTNDVGEYSIGLSGGTWDLMVGSPDSDILYNKPPVQVTFASDGSSETQTVDFQVSKAGGGVTGKLVLPGGSFPPPNSFQVNLFSPGAGGRGGPVGDLGAFSIKLPPGIYNLQLFSMNNLPYQVPAGITVEVREGVVVDLGTIILTVKDYTIRGRVIDASSGSGVPNIRIQANTRAATGPGGWYGESTTDGSGNYTMSVTEGTYDIMILTFPEPGKPTYMPSGPPATVSVGPSTPDKTVSGVDLKVTLADAAIQGVVRFNGQPIRGVEGWVNARPAEAQWGGPGPGAGGPITGDGTFLIKLTAGSYILEANFREGQYSSAGETKVTVASGQTVSATIDLKANNSIIQGFLRTPEGKIVTGYEADVHAFNPERPGPGAHTRTGKDGAYKLRVGAGNWHVNGHFFGGGAPFMIPPPSPDSKISIGENQTVNYDITVYAADSTITGTLKKPDGSAVGMAFVHADNRLDEGEMGPPAPGKGPGGPEKGFGTGGPANPDGTFTLRVPAGTYMVGAGLPPGIQGLMNPAMQKVVVAPGKPARIDLIFRQADAVITGALILNGKKVPGHVDAWSEKGGFSDTHSNDGSFTLNVSKGDTWHVRGVLEGRMMESLDEQGFYESGDQTMTVTAAKTTLNLTLTKSAFRLPPPLSVTFDASQQKIVQLPDGAEITIPAGAFASSGNVRLSVTPKAAMARQNRAKPVGIGYDLEVYDENNNKITTEFNSNVTIVIPYTPEMLAAAGITEEDLLGSYWDETANTWKEVSGVSLDKEARTITITTNHFTQFAATTSKAGSSKPSVSYAWKTVSTKGALGGSVSTNNVAGSSATLRFTGASATLLTTKGPDQGIAVVYVDGKAVKRLDNYGAKPFLKVPVPIKGLRNTAHTLALVVSGTKNAASKGAYVSLDALVAGKTTVQNTASSVRYAWKSQSAKGSGSGTLALSDLAGTAFTVKFKGSNFIWYTATGPTMGVAKVFVDGKLKATIDNYSARAALKVARTVSKLSNSVHTAVIQVTGTKGKAAKGSYVVVDYVGVR